MIERKDLFSIPFYDKTNYSGSYQGMRFRIEKQKQEEQVSLLVTYWPGPYCFTATDRALMNSRTFSYSPEGLDEACQWLNEIYRQQEDTFRAVHI